MNKLVYADMPINMAMSLLNNVCGIKKVNVLSFDFGLNHLRNLVSNIDFVSGDEVFLTNVPFAVQLVKDDMLEEVDGFSTFINSFYILDMYGNLKLAKTLTDKELRPAHNFEKLIVNGGFVYKQVPQGFIQDYPPHPMFIIDESEVEVIGNKFDNPELVGVEE